MRTENELAAFYSRNLLPVLRPLEEKRKRLVSGYIIISVIAAVSVLLWVFISGSQKNNGLWWLFFFPAAGLIWYGMDVYSLSKTYKTEFKSSVVAGLVKFLDEGLYYLSESYIPISEYEDSRIFLHNVDRYSGDDLVTGKLGKTDIKFSEIHSEYKTESVDSKGNRHTQWHTIFHGLFFIADFNKDFQGCTVVLPDTAEKMFGFLGGMMQKMNIARPKLVKLEDPEFEKNFVVYGDDQITARYILSTSLMERMLSYKKETGKNVYFSFVNSKIYVAVAYNKNMFEPGIFRSLLDFETIKGHFKDLELASGIVEELNLNTRIWSKA